MNKIRLRRGAERVSAIHWSGQREQVGRQLTVDNNGTSGVPRVILTSVYDAASNRTRLSAAVGGTADFENDYTFDDMNRMTRVEQIGQGGGNTVASKGANFAYNALSQFTSVERQVKPSSTWDEVATFAGNSRL